MSLGVKIFTMGVSCPYLDNSSTSADAINVLSASFFASELQVC